MLHQLTRIPIWREPLAAVELQRLLRSRTFKHPDLSGDGRPVMMIPGFLCGDDYFALLAGWLKRGGYTPRRSGIICNVDCSEDTLQRLSRRLQKVAAEHDRPVTVIGHSRGGLLGRALTVRHPDLVSGLITMGSPHVGGLDDVHWTLKGPALEALTAVNRTGVSQVLGDGCKPGQPGGCCENYWQDMEARFPRRVPFLSLYSRTDGVVGWQACKDPDARNVEVPGTHAGMSVNVGMCEQIAAELRQLRRQRSKLPVTGQSQLAAAA